MLALECPRGHEHVLSICLQLCGCVHDTPEHDGMTLLVFDTETRAEIVS